jgi:hypothetical protein
MPGDTALERILEDHPDLQLLRVVADEVEHRLTREQRLPVYRYRDSRADRTLLAPPGSAVLFVARAGSDTLLGLRRTLAERDLDAINDAGRPIYENLVDRQPVALAEAVDAFVSQGISVDLSYKGTPLVSNAFLPDDLDVAAFPMPFTGGPIDDDAFTIAARYRENVPGWLDAVLVVNEPDLSDLERAALDLVPADDSAVQIGKSAMCYAITAVTVFIVVAGATYACPGSRDVFHLDDEVVKQLRPEMTARELLSLRRQALEHRGR